MDCTIPCEVNADLERVRALNAVLSDALYADTVIDAALFATEQACLSSAATEVVLPTDVCTQ